MVYTLRVVTNVPMDMDALCAAVQDSDIEKVASVEVANFRVLPSPRKAKEE